MLRAQAIGRLVTERFQQLQQRFPQWVGDVRGLGATVGMELVVEGNVNRPATDMTKEVLKA